MPAPANLVHQTSTTTGTGSLTLSAVNGKQSFVTAFGSGGSNVFDYFISHQTAAEYERGTGSIAAGLLVRNTVIESTNANAAVNFSAGTKDVSNDIPAASQYYVGGTDVAVADGGTGSSTAATARTALGLAIGTNVQAYDATLASIAALGTAADKIIYTTGVDTWAELAVTSVGRGLLDDTTAAAQLSTLTARGQGKETIFIPAGAMKSRTTNGAAAGSTQQTTNLNMTVSLDFDTTTQEFAQFSVWFPKSWNLGTVTFQPSFSQLTTASGGVVFGLAGVAVSDADALDVAFGTAVTSTKTAGTANLEYQGAESSAITIAGTPTAGDRVMFQINRTVADGSDTLAQDARLHGVRLFFTTNAATDT